MANRILMGNRSTGGYGVYVSKSGSNVLNCARKDLLFDASQSRAGEVYAGGSLSSLGNTTQNFLSTGSKSNLGYIPLVVSTEDRRGEFDDGSANQSGSEQFYSSRIDVLEFTTSTIQPKSLGSTADQNFDFSANQIIAERFNGQSCTNLKFMVLKIPLAYGYMTNTYFG